MSVLVQEPSLSLTSRASRPVDGALVNLRWAMIPLAWVSVLLVTGTVIPEAYFLVWLVCYGAYNGLLWVGVHYRQLPARLPLLGLAGDILFLSILPLLPGVSSPYLILLAIFPTLVAAMRFGVPSGALVSLIVLLPYEGAALVNLLPPGLRAALPIRVETRIDLWSALVPVLALLGAVILVGYLTAREREAAVGAAQTELEELRRAIATVRLFYESTDALANASNYVQILEMMLQSGVSGMPHGRPGQGDPVGLALLFDDSVANDGDRALIVAASRGIDRADATHVLPGKAGIVAQAMTGGDPVPFTRLSNDPELGSFTSLRRAHTGVCYPLQSGLDVYGVVILATPGHQMPSEQHLRLMRAFINQAAVAFQNAQLYKNLRAERDRIIEAESSARARLARDLHDGPTQSMAALAMRLDFVRLLLERDPGQAKEELEQAREAVMGVGKDLRGLLFTLRPLTLESQGLSAALRQYEQRLRETDNMPITIQPGVFGKELDPNIAATVFAIIEEAVNNARKHAVGAPVHVSVQQQNGALVAVVSDEGGGFELSAVHSNYADRGSLGLVNMRERARLVDGQFTIESAPGRGTRVQLRVPLSDRRTAARTSTPAHSRVPPELSS